MNQHHENENNNANIEMNHIEVIEESIERRQSLSNENKEAPENAQLHEIALEVNDLHRENEFFISQPNIHLVRCGVQRDVKIINKTTTVIKSETVITEITNGKPDSFLSNPQNVEGKFYYLIQDYKTAKFNPTFAWREALLNLVSLEEFSLFLNELHSLKNQTKTKANKMLTQTEKIRYSLECIGFILVLCSIGLFVSCPFVYEYSFIVFISLAPSCLFFGIILLSLGYYYYGQHYFYRVKILHNENTDQMNLINKWNEQLFIRKKVILTYPKHFNYIQINTDPEWKLEIENHKIN